jgi:hypothetical protein
MGEGEQLNYFPNRLRLYIVERFPVFFWGTVSLLLTLATAMISKNFEPKKFAIDWILVLIILLQTRLLDDWTSRVMDQIEFPERFAFKEIDAGPIMTAVFSLTAIPFFTFSALQYLAYLGFLLVSFRVYSWVNKRRPSHVPMLLMQLKYPAIVYLMSWGEGFRSATRILIIALVGSAAFFYEFWINTNLLKSRGA